MSHPIDFVKMHGAGNDFIVMDARPADFPVAQVLNQIPGLCHRRTGIGADGVLLLLPSDETDYTMQYLNADGSEAGMCGNGARCLARFAMDRGLPAKLVFTANQLRYRAEVFDHYVSVFFPVKPIPVVKIIDGVTWFEIHSGTEHVVSIDQEYMKAPNRFFREKGRLIRNRIDLFPVGTNVNFASILDQNRLRLVTYERGVEDLTLACGTGAIATAIARCHARITENAQTDPEQPTIPGAPTLPEVHPPPEVNHHIQIDCPGGPLEVSFSVVREHDTPVYKNIILHGPAVTVCEGRVTL